MELTKLQTCLVIYLLDANKKHDCQITGKYYKFNEIENLFFSKYFVTCYVRNKTVFFVLVCHYILYAQNEEEL